MSQISATSRDILTILSSLIAVSIVFAAAGGVLPAQVLPRAPDQFIAAIPHINVIISIAAVITIAAGWRWITRGEIQRHRVAMLSALILFLAFLVLYLYRLTALGGPASFDGSTHVYRYVYLPILTAHIVLAVICIPLLFDALALALSMPIERLPSTRHPRIGRIAASLWIISFILGIVVYLLLYWI